LALIVLTATVALLLYAVNSGLAGPYLNSAHGNNTYGVNRARTAGFGYARGNCAHCHEQHASIEGQALASPAPYNFALFYDDVIGICNLFCFTCHSGNATWQPTVNYPYARNFGGSPDFYPNIYQQFCDADSLPAVCGSRHHLGQIRNGLLSPVGQAWGFSDDPNPCVACHNPHADQRNHPVADVSGGGKLNTAIRRPSHYKSTDPKDFLWGDDDNRPGKPERMDEYAASVGGTYQSPYYGNTTGTKYEPSGNASPSDGSDLPNYVTFCLDCHQYAQYDPERGATVEAIDWSSSTGDRHGGYPANDCNQGPTFEGTLRAPYDSAGSNYVLSCTDCHEPHGTKQRLHLIRRWINGEIVDADTGTCDEIADWVATCQRCHDVPHPTWGGCGVCHGHGVKWEGAGECFDKPTF